MSRRHLLVIATQCDDMPTLDRLEHAAQSLHDAFLDPNGGECIPGLRDGRAMLNGRVAAGEIVAAVNEAARYAGDQDATLVLALLGHGFVIEGTAHLYYMAAGSREQVRRDAVDVPKLLLDAVDDVRVNGLIGVIDTCHAGGAPPDLDEILTGTRGGHTRLALLMAAGAAQSAYNLKVSRTLAELLRSGVAGAGRKLDIAGVRPSLIQRTGQPVARFEYDGAIVTSGLWLGHNRRHTDAVTTGTLGALGSDRLRAALAGLAVPLEIPPGCDLRALTELARAVGNDPSPEGAYAKRTIDKLAAAAKTIVFLRGELPSALSTPALRQAQAMLDRLDEPRSMVEDRYACRTEVDFVEDAVLRRSGVDGDFTRALAQFVVALADTAGLTAAAQSIKDWAARVDIPAVHLNDAIAAFSASRTSQRLRLIVSLHAFTAAGRWPDRIQAWLLDRAQMVATERFGCEDSQPGVEDALTAAVEWALAHAARVGVTLRRIDVATPTGFLTTWRPEDVEYGRRLGMGYNVLTHWSSRLDPPRNRGWIVNDVIQLLEELPSGIRPSWISDTGDLIALRQSLTGGRYEGAVGLTTKPRSDDLLELLLSYLPVVLWPHHDSEFAPQDCDLVERVWARLPDGLHEAYRARWKHGRPDPVADLRLVWDDLDWLKFCASYRGSTPSRSTQ